MIYIIHINEFSSRHKNDFSFALCRSSICINKFVQPGVSVAVLSSNCYLMHLFLSPLVVTSKYIIP